MKRIFCISILIAATSCASNGGGVGIAAGNIAKGADENGVSVNKNSFMTTADTYKIALTHCLKFNKTPKLTRKASSWDFWMKDQYSCVDASTN